MATPKKKPARAALPPPVPPADGGLGDPRARTLAEAWRKFAHVTKKIAKTKTGWQVATTGTQVEYVSGARALVIRQGVGVNYNAPITEPDEMRARLGAESAAQSTLLGGATLELAVLPYRHLDPLVRSLGVEPSLEIVATRSVTKPTISDGDFVELVRSTMKAGIDWRSKRQLLFHAGR